MRLFRSLLSFLLLPGAATAQSLLEDVGAQPDGVNEGSAPWNRSTIGPTVWFAAEVGRSGVEPWRTDSTATGTVVLTELRGGLALDRATPPSHPRRR